MDGGGVHDDEKEGEGEEEEIDYFILNEMDKVSGPFRLEALRRMYLSGKVNSETLLWHDAIEEDVWIALAHLPRLEQLLQAGEIFLSLPEKKSGGDIERLDTTVNPLQKQFCDDESGGIELGAMRKDGHRSAGLKDTREPQFNGLDSSRGNENARTHANVFSIAAVALILFSPMLHLFVVDITENGKAPKIACEVFAILAIVKTYSRAMGRGAKYLALCTLLPLLTSIIIMVMVVPSATETTPPLKPNRGQCEMTKPKINWIGSSVGKCDRHMKGTFYFRFNKSVFTEDTQWPLHAFFHSQETREESLAEVRFGSLNVQNESASVSKILWWEERADSILDLVGSLLSIQPRYRRIGEPCQRYWENNVACPRSALYVSDNASCAEKLSEYLCNFQFPPCTFDCKDASECALSESRLEAAKACRHVLPAFSKGPLWHFDVYLRKDYERARNWIHDFMKAECISSASRILEALEDLASVDLRARVRPIEACLRNGSGPDYCDPNADHSDDPGEPMKDSSDFDQSTVFLVLFFSLYALGALWIVWHRDVLAIHRIVANKHSLAAYVLCQFLNSVLLYEVKKQRSVFAIGVLLLSAVYIQHTCALIFQEVEGGIYFVKIGGKKIRQEELPKLLRDAVETKHGRACRQFCKSMRYGGRFYRLRIILSELFEVPLQVWSLHFKVKKLELGVSLLGLGFVMLNCICTPIIVILNMKISHLLIADVLFDASYFGFNLAVFGDSGGTDVENIVDVFSLIVPSIKALWVILRVVRFSHPNATPFPEARSTKDLRLENCDWKLNRYANFVTHKSTIYNTNDKRAPSNMKRRPVSKRRVSIGTYVENTVHNVAGNISRQTVAGALCALLGTLLFMSTVYRGITEHSRCAAILGKAYHCATPQYLFRNGLFGDAECDFDSIEALNCANKDLTSLPSLEMLQNVRLIDVTNNKRLHSLPLALLNRSHVLLNASGSPAAIHLDWSYKNGEDLVHTLSRERLMALCTKLGESACRSIQRQSDRCSTRLTGELSGFSSLANLEVLDLYRNDLYGRVPDLSKNSNLQQLNLGKNKLNGSLSIVSMPKQLRELNLAMNKIRGSFPFISSLSNLKILQLQENELHGTIPSLEMLNDLQKIDLGRNMLSGAIPRISSLTLLESLDLSNNGLGDNIPNFPISTALKRIHLHNNNLTGSVPSLAALVSLQELDLSSNQLSGTIPKLEGLTSLREVFLYSNQLSGTIPKLEGLNSLQDLFLFSNQLSGTIPKLEGLTSLQQLFLNTNNLTGTIRKLEGLTSLQQLVLFSNQLSGTIPKLEELTSLRALGLSSNQLSGTIPKLEGLTSLQEVALFSNQLSGTIPKLEGLASLQEVALFSNQLSGSIPREISTVSYLQMLALYNTQISGTIPREISMLSNLQELHLQNTQINGTIPREISMLSNLQTLSLRDTQI
eukprot:g2427.t1